MHLLVLASTVTGCVSISGFSSSSSMSVGITISAATIKVYETTPGIKKYKSIQVKNLSQYSIS